MCTVVFTAEGPEKGITHELSILFTIMWAYVISGTIIGVVLGAYLEDWLGLRLAMSFAGLISVPVVIYTLVYFEETAPVERKCVECVCVCVTHMKRPTFCRV